MTANLESATRAPLYNLAIGGCLSADVESRAALPKRAIANETWQTTAPTMPGLYLFACEESDGEWEVLHVVHSDLSETFEFRPMFTGCPSFHPQKWNNVGNLLMVICPHLGLTPLQAYHDGCTHPRWRLVSPSANPSEELSP